MNLVAIHGFNFGRRVLSAGEKFETDDKMGRVLVLAKKAKIAEVAEDATEEAQPSDRKGRYRRKDMRAE